ncbi:ectoine/hydroxyectoine ABC transporter permease subunit EhuC [Ornithinibacillus sp. BX22]|uniref:Ectoine/hydroxyectoine ABC transporter permease subunit EhuC n=2 Tax=Ornithinibacillus TaxID=484508 RepID=A0A923RK40_9BACI|nr:MULTISPECIES: ectoine/hydroxyectoine ABC transporter permease subunit EhuC [Ornithinibacillus]MBC5636922.1 ectoine/hydroxyectoine ABC transporter permease subunit EhuC [Ornithinibacillus hominis]MBS3681488.1 ectoine/hydroxyectoine ABC transporter permease subunit EhuC [Ornithinibacillus massiliensis]
MEFLYGGVIKINAIIEVFPVLIRGIHITITVFILSVIFAYLFAFIAGFSRLSNNRMVRGITGFYVEIFRGTSLIVQLFWLYYAIPMLFNIGIDNKLMAGVLAISLNYGAYMSEIVRGSILAVDKGQTEASIALNLSRIQRIRVIIFPQALRMMLPEFGNYSIQMLKATSLVSLIGMTDILYHGNILRSTDLSQAPTVYFLLLVFYFIMALPLILLTRKWEQISKRGVAST